jgi:hypothetical protein
VACAVVAIAATLMRRTLPLGELYAAKSTAILAVVAISAATLVRAHHPFTRFGAANQMTLIRAGLVALVAGLIGEPAVAPVAAVAVGVAAAVEIFDGVDGWLARRTTGPTDFGARFDMETDAALGLVLSALLVPVPSCTSTCAAHTTATRRAPERGGKMKLLT